ncbi:iron-sulfur cluster biosynthesis family protein [Companilactobacillus ginsenosidimutans]|uniref:Core domain-containing protein n=1 Tax=Companilactobacillus ginsenosidimutans TaxID=1007676 RepID=A0A0H4QXD2_9LACO|nr:iron-sulfur cluster biosynthesis family protein [Companilactobacillus ginsenosidimutans]AKP66145.1 hypothetical protein ABM34_00330 [Companilactobacillus ginsenosidimutans]
MKIEIKPEAKRYLSDKIPAGSTVILTTDDGSNKYSSIGATCAMADKFQLIIVNQPDSKFNVELENNADFDLSMASYEDYLVSDGLKLDYTHGFLILSDNTGILGNTVSVVDWRNVTPESEAQRFNEMKKLGQFIC